jgi:hypothetical protein
VTPPARLLSDRSNFGPGMPPALPLHESVSTTRDPKAALAINTPRQQPQLRHHLLTPLHGSKSSPAATRRQSFFFLFRDTANFA